METLTETVELKTTLPAKVKEYEIAINKLKEDYSGLKLTDVTDEKQYGIIRAARIDVKKVRVGVEKFCKAERDVANAYIKANTTKEKEILSMLTPLENYLTQEEKKWEDEQERIANVAKQEAQERAVNRVKLLLKLGMQYDGNRYVLGELSCGTVEIEGYDDKQFDTITDAAHDISEKLRIAKEEKDRLDKEEAERLELQKKEQEAERLRLKAFADEQEKKLHELEARADELARKEAEQAEKERLAAKAIKDAADKLEAEKQAAIEKDRRAKELEQAKKEAAEKAIRDKEIADKKAEEEKIAAEKLKAEKEAAKLARQPDKVKLLEYLKTIPVNVAIQLKTKEAKAIHEIIDEAINLHIEIWKKDIEKL